MVTVDFKALIGALMNAGWSQPRIAEYVGCSLHCVQSYRAERIRPGFDNGAALLRLWCQCYPEAGNAFVGDLFLPEKSAADVTNN